MIIVIADDITGAAEIAGIAFSHGLQTRLVTSTVAPLADCDVLVVATDTRSMSQAETIREIRRISEWVSAVCPSSVIFHKVDSALRGHVMVELSVLMSSLGYKRALYIPANPSKGRIISGGVYAINGLSLDKTEFANDPEFPITTAVLESRFEGMKRWCVDASEGIYYADAESADDMQRYVDEAPQGTLLAGAADMFTALLQSLGLRAGNVTAAVGGLTDGSALIICGSTQSQSLASFDYIVRNGIVTSMMPLDVFQSQVPLTAWSERIMQVYLDSRSLILAIPHYTSSQPIQKAAYLRRVMSYTVGELIRVSPPHELIIEGGATAYSVLQTIGWSEFVITAEVSPGVVRMQTPSGDYVTLKPGSYPWGQLFGE